MDIKYICFSSLLLLMVISHGYLMLFHGHKMGSQKDDRPQDPLFQPTLIQFSLIYYLCIYSIYLLMIFQNESFSPHRQIFILSGFCIYIIGLALRLWSIRSLKEFFTFEIGIRGHHKIIEIGPYAWLRHPSYSGYLLMALGTSLGFGHAFWGIMNFVPALGFLIIRIDQEEKMLIKHFGEKYLSYQKKTRRLVPGLW